MMQWKNILKKAVYGAKSDSESYVEHLKTIGMKIGDSQLRWFGRRIYCEARECTGRG